MRRSLTTYGFLCLLSCSSLFATQEVSLKPGLPCFAATNLTCRVEGQRSLQVQMSEPVVIGVASRPEKWGFFQFPVIMQWEDGTLCATWSMAADSIKSYGKGESGCALSRDGGKTWTQYSGQHGISGQVLPNGDRIRITTPKAIEVSKLKLPEPVGGAVDNYGNAKQTLYKLDQLPPELQGVCQSRLPKGAREWMTERVPLTDAQALRYSLTGLFPIVWWGDLHIASDGSLIAGIYPGFHIRNDGTVDSKCGVFFYRSTDFARSWKIQGRIPYEYDLQADPKGAQRMGFTEPTYEVLADGTLLCVARTTDGVGDGPMYASWSRDLGRTWSKPQTMAPSGVLPHLLRLTNGVVVLSSGRPGVQLRFSADGQGKKWTAPLEMLPWAGQKEAVSCGYTTLLATGPDRFLLIYSDFKYRTAANEIRKAIKVREVVVTPRAMLQSPKVLE